MKFSTCLNRGLVALITCCGLEAPAAPPAGDYVEGEVLVRFAAQETRATIQEFADRQGVELVRTYDWLSAHDGALIGLLRSTTTSTAELRAQLVADPAIDFVEPNFRRHFTAMHLPTDVRFGQMWGLQNTGQAVNGTSGTSGADIRFLQAWGMARPTTNEFVVGVIDSGIDPTHPDLTNNLWINPIEIPDNGLDDDTNGYIDDVHGYDFTLATGNLTDSGLHGTHVAGTVAATGNNGLGVIGVDFRAHLMPLKTSVDGLYLSSAAIIDATQYAAMMKSRGVNIVALNGSYGGGDYSEIERESIEAAGALGIVFCVAAGNESANNDAVLQYPAAYRTTNMIVVAATDQRDNLASFSNYGATTVDLAAPGVNVLSSVPFAEAGYSSYADVSTNRFTANALEFSGDTSALGVSGAIYACGLGYPEDFPLASSNYIALIQRGDLTFAEKVFNAMDAGASAAIIYNNIAGNFDGTLQYENGFIPAISISQADGQTLQGLLPAAGTVVNAPDPAQIYKLLNGTSMATPHVSGAVAFAARNFPEDTVARRISRILTNATPVASLAGITTTGARLNLANIVDSDHNGLPDWWEQFYFGQETGTDPNGDADHDGLNEGGEFLAGTSPTNAASVLRLAAAAGAESGQIILQWPSAEGRYYRLLRDTDVAGSFSAAIMTNLLATPPLNQVTDVPPAGVVGAYYRLQLEP